MTTGEAIRLAKRKRAIRLVEKIFPDQKLIIISVEREGRVALAANCPKEDVKVIVDAVSRNWGEVNDNQLN